jgi:hypothetical protein
MTQESLEVSALAGFVSRLERVERQNRMLKGGGLVAMLLAMMVLVMGQARTNRTVETENLILKDETGRTRAELRMLSDRPTLRFFDPAGAPRALLSDFGFSIHDPQAKVSATHLPALQLSEGGLMFSDKNRDMVLAALTTTGAEGELNLHGSHPAVYVRDVDGFELSVGSTALETPRTGEKRQTSAASIVLFGKDKKVLWSAP